MLLLQLLRVIFNNLVVLEARMFKIIASFAAESTRKKGCYQVWTGQKLLYCMKRGYSERQISDKKQGNQALGPNHKSQFLTEVFIRNYVKIRVFECLIGFLAFLILKLWLKSNKIINESLNQFLAFGSKAQKTCIIGKVSLKTSVKKLALAVEAQGPTTLAKNNFLVQINCDSAEFCGSTKHVVGFLEGSSFFRGNHCLLQYVDASIWNFLDYHAPFRLQVGQLVIQEVECRYWSKKYWKLLCHLCN